MIRDYMRILNWIFDKVEYLFASREQKDFLKHVPPRCRECEILGLCRNPKKHWKCVRGCLYLKNQEKKK